jgi:hypothetical protein
MAEQTLSHVIPFLQFPQTKELIAPHQAILPAVVMTSVRCSEKACPFPADSRDGICGHHRAMFTEDDSAEVLLAEALPRRGSGKHDGIDLARPEIVTEIVSRGLTTKIGKLVPAEEWLEDKNWHRTRSKVTMNALYSGRRRAGVCILCGSQPAPGRKLCSGCLKRANDRVQRLKQIGVCVLCGQSDASRGLTKCASCRERSHSYARRAYLKRTAHLPKRKPISSEERNRRVRLRCEKRREAGVCVGCSGVREDQSTRCKICRERHNKSENRARKKLIAAGTCVACRRRSVAFDLTLCQKCARKHAARIRQRYRQKLFVPYKASVKLGHRFGNASARVVPKLLGESLGVQSHCALSRGC